MVIDKESDIKDSLLDWKSYYSFIFNFDQFNR